MKQLANQKLEEDLLGEISAASTTDATATRINVEKLGIEADHFGFETTRDTFAAMLRHLRRGEACGIVQLEPEMKAAGKFPGWLIQAQGRAGGVAEDWFLAPMVRELKDLSARRRIMAMGADLVERARNDVLPIDDALVNLSAAMNSFVNGAANGLRSLDSKMMLVAEQMDHVGQGKSPVLPVGFEAWDTNVGGWWPTLNVIGGHPSQGKSGLIASMMMRLAERGVRGTIFTLEDPAEWLLYRFLAFYSRVPAFVIRTRPLTVEQHEAVGKAWPVVDALAKLVLFDERSRLRPGQISTAAREAILSKNSEYIVIDHKEEISYGSESGRFDLEVAAGLSELRAIAKSHGKPVVLLSQLSRASKPPHTMQDFKNASAVEEVARMAAIIWTKTDEPTLPTVSVVKNTNGRRDFDIPLELDEVSGLVMERRAPPPKAEAPNQERMF